MNCLLIFVFIALIQTCLILYLFFLLHTKEAKVFELTQLSDSMVKKVAIEATKTANIKHDQCISFPQNQTSGIKSQHIGGVAATLMLHAPLWYQRRYTLMIQNVVNNIPSNWIIQIFYTGTGQSLAGIKVNPGIEQFIKNGKVILTLIPQHILQKKKKRYELMAELWLWQNILAEKVLIFGGGSVICSNSPQLLSQFLYFDYIGSPWNSFKGLGGDGSFSLRSRRLMIQIIEYEYSKYDQDLEKLKSIYKTWGQEDHFFVSRMREMMLAGLLQNTNSMPEKLQPRKKSHHKDQRSPTKVFIANKNDSIRFAAMDSYFNHQVFAVSGTLPALTFQDREKFLQYCPEIKIFYPSLHDPHCFGASPDGEKCSSSICALKPKTERRGGC